MNNFREASSSDEEQPYSFFWDRALFIALILIEAAVFFYLIQGHRLVGGHDGFHYFTMQYYALNNIINGGDIPQWIPQMTHGTDFTFGYVLLGGVFFNILFLFDFLVEHLNFIPIFYSGYFVDELLLLTGVWFLGKRFFTSPFTCFFVCLSIMGSCIWFLQPSFNFHLYYAIPLILYFIHKFFDTGKWRYFFLAGNLLLIQYFGNLIYSLPLTLLVIFLYFASYILCNWPENKDKIKKLKLGWSAIILTLILSLSFAVIFALLKSGADQMQVASNMRSAQGGVSLEVFLNYGGRSWYSWLELLLGVSPCVDYTLYAGVVCLPFILLAVTLNLNKTNLHFLVSAILLLLFSMGTFVSVFFYYSWPMMNYFRHLVSVSSIIKIFLCFLAGFGFDALFFKKSLWRNVYLSKVFLVFLSIIMAGISLFLWYLATHQGISARLIRTMVPEYLPPLRILSGHLTSFLFFRTIIFSISTAIFFLLLVNIKKRKFFMLSMALLLMSHAADMYSFKFMSTVLYTVPLNNSLYRITAFQPMPYQKRRSLFFWENNPRAEILNILPIVDPGSTYWTLQAFFFKDQLNNSFRTEFWMKPLDKYLKAYWGQDIHDPDIQLEGLFFYSPTEFPRLDFPQNHPAALKISGATEDKIQFFSKAEFVSSEDTIASLITRPGYRGDVIFLSPLEEKSSSQNPIELTSGALAADKRLHLPYQVKLFDSNNIVITTDANLTETTWLMYSDVWHPLWRATVNGKETPVYKANLAYKAIKLEKGYNKVHFYFKSGFMTLFHYVFGLNALFWLVYIFYLAGKIAFGHNFLAKNMMNPFRCFRRK